MLAGVDLNGRLFPAVPVPFDAVGRVVESAQEALLRSIAGEDVGGVAVWAHTGRGLRLDRATRGRILASWRSIGRAGWKVIAAAGCDPVAPTDLLATAGAVAMAQQARDLGADALLVHPPTRFRGRPDEHPAVLRFHEELAAVGLPLILFFLYEAAGGIRYAPELLSQLLELDTVLGVKVATLDSVMTFQEVAALMEDRHPAKVLITGEDRFLGYSLMAGARSALIGMGCAALAPQSALLRAHRDRDATAFLALSAKVDDLARHTFRPPMEGYIRRMLWCLVHEGVIDAEAAHDPWGPPLDPAEFDSIGACLRRIGVIP